LNIANFPIEFNNEINEIKKSENKYYSLAVDRLSKLAGEHDDISGGLVNFKQPAQGRESSHIYEVTIIVYMKDSNQVAATEKGKRFQATLNGALDAVKRQVQERRTQERMY